MTTTSFKTTKSEKLFYASSFKQLTEVQQQQVGFWVGAAVGDAAGRALDTGLAYVNNSEDSSRQAIAHIEASGEEILFFPPGEASRLGLDTSTVPDVGPLRSHSFTFECAMGVLATIASNKGHLVPDEALARIAAVSNSYPEAYAQQHGFPLHTTALTIGLPTIYPWCSDAACREECAEPLLRELTQRHGATVGIDDAAGLEGQSGVEVPAPVDLSDISRDIALTSTGVTLRFLQANPDAVKNAAFRAAPFGGLPFPADCVPFLPEAAHNFSITFTSAASRQVRAPAAEAALCSPTLVRGTTSVHARVSAECNVIRSSFDIARTSRSFSDGLRAAVRQGGPCAQRGMLAGALLGAKLGIRQIPQEWIRATADHETVATYATELAQWSWNPAGSQ